MVLADVPGTDQVNLQSAEYLLLCKQLLGFQVPPGPDVGEVGAKPAPKPTLNRLGFTCKISSGSVQGFGFPLALNLPTDKQTSAHPFLYR